MQRDMVFGSDSCILRWQVENLQTFIRTSRTRSQICLDQAKTHICAAQSCRLICLASELDSHVEEVMVAACRSTKCGIFRQLDRCHGWIWCIS